MKHHHKKLIALAMALPLVGVVEAAPVFNEGFNEIFFNNFENLYRDSEACTPATCFAPIASDPAGWQRVNTGIGSNTLVGDVFAGIFNVQNIDNGGSTIWGFTPTDQFTGYFAQEVRAIQFAAADPSNRDHIALDAPAVDPFGRLAAGDMFELYVDNTTAFTSGGGSLLTDIANATDGALWATLAAGAYVAPPGVDTDGFAYSHTTYTGSINASDTEAFFGLDLSTLGPAYNAGTLALINELSNENEIGGTIPTLLCGPGDIGVVACNNIIGSSEIEANPNFALGVSEWSIRSNDPFGLIRTIPEPSMVALFGLGLIGLGFNARRRRSV